MVGRWFRYPYSISTVVRRKEFATWNAVDLSTGNLLIVDNHRIAHGREPYIGEREHWVAMGWIDSIQCLKRTDTEVLIDSVYEIIIFKVQGSSGTGSHMNIHYEAKRTLFIMTQIVWSFSLLLVLLGLAFNAVVILNMSAMCVVVSGLAFVLLRKQYFVLAAWLMGSLLMLASF